MKRILGVLFLVAAVSTSMFAQEAETLISGEIESGGFGGPVVKGGPVNGETGVFVGGRGGWIINHSFILGGGGYGLVSNVKAKNPGPLGQTQMNLAYGGLEIEYIASSHKLVHVSVMTLIGAGGVGYRNGTGTNMQDASDSFFILEPGAQVNLNVAEFFRISAGVSYRFVQGLSSAVSTNADLSGPTGVLTFRFGKF